MRTTSSRISPASTAYWPVSQKRFCGLIVVALLLALGSALAVSPDDQYLRIYGLIEQADALAAKGETGQALATYRQAQVALQSFQKGNPGWNAKLVNYRFNYLAQNVAALTEKPAAPAEAGAAGGNQVGQPKSKSTASAADSEAKLLDAGAEPRKELRLHPKAGDKQTTLVTIKIALDTSIGEMPIQASSFLCSARFVALHMRDDSPSHLSIRPVAVVEVLRTALAYFTEGRVKVTYIIDTVMVTVLTEVMAFWYKEMEWEELGMVIALVLSLALIRIFAVRFSPRRFREEL